MKILDIPLGRRGDILYHLSMLVSDLRGPEESTAFWLFIALCSRPLPERAFGEVECRIVATRRMKPVVGDETKGKALSGRFFVSREPVDDSSIAVLRNVTWRLRG